MTPRAGGAAALAIVLAAAAACGDSAGPASPATIEIAAGDGQDGPANGPAPVPLRVTLRTASGAPLAGGRVAWSVASGGAAVGPAVSTSDASGQATTTVTLGPPGDVAVEARAGGLPAVTFRLRSLERCAYLAPFRLDTTAAGDLSPADCVLGDGSFVDFHRLPSAGQQAVRVTLRASFDAWLFFYVLSGAVVALDDDGGGGSDASFQAVVPAGTFVVGANSRYGGQVGPYTLTAANVPLSVGCEGDLWLAGPVTINDSITSTGCPGPDYADRLLLILGGNQTLTVSETSLDVAPFLRLRRISDQAPVAEADASGGDPHTATLVYATPGLDIYVLEVGAAASGQTGAYTLTVAAFTPGPPATPPAGWAP
jgi:hypothetical protein